MSTLLIASTLLLDVLARENEALQRMDLPGAMGLVTEKREAVERFEAVRLASRPTIPGPAADPALQAVAHRLQAALLENRLLLERAISVQRKIMALLAQAAREQTPVQGYGARGHYQCGRNDRPFALSARA